MIGRNQEIETMLKIIEDYLKNQDKNKFTLIRGGYGVGKSLLVRVLLNKIKIDEHKYLQSKDDNIIFLTSSLGPMQKTLKMNGLRAIFQQLFILVSKLRNEAPTQNFLEQIFPKTNANHEFYEFFCELVGIKQHNWIINFPIPRDPILTKNQQQEKDKQCKKVFFIQYKISQWAFNLAVILFNNFIDTNQQNQFQSSDSSNHRYSNHSVSSSSNSNKQSQVPTQLKPIVIVLEDFHLYDNVSYSIIQKLIQNYYRLCFFATIRDQYNEVQRKFEQNKSKTQDQVLTNGLNKIEKSIMDDYIVIDLKPLKKTEQLDELKELIKQHFNIEQFIFEKPQKQKEKVLPQVIKKQHDHLLYFENKPYLLTNENANLLLLPYFYLRTMGNPLSCIHLIDNLIKSRYLYINEKNPTTYILSEQFRQALWSEETLNFEAPTCWVQVNGPIIDSLTCLESLVLKFASVAGDIFDIQTLNKIQPFKDTLTSEKLIKILEDLDAKDAIEVLDINEFNIYYRFTHPFMREVLYQRMTYNHRRLLHRAVAEALQTMNYPFGDLIEQKKLEFHWQQAEQRWNQPQQQEKFSHKAKRSIIVKQIQQVLSQAKNENFAIIKGEILEKKSDANISWAPRYILLTSRDLRYYYTEDDFIRNVEPLGAIQLKNIFGIQPLNQKEKGNKNWAFQMQASSWLKKSTEMPLRTFYFAAANEDQLEEWTIYLEFTKAKAVYDEFVNNFGKISFPLGQSSDNYDQNIRVDYRTKPKKIDFGWSQNEVANINKNNFSRRASRASRASKAFQAQIGHKQNKVTIEDLTTQTLRPTNSQTDIQNLKFLVRTFLRLGTLVLYGHIFEMTLYNENEDNYKNLGQNLRVMAAKKQFFMIERSGSDEDQIWKKNQIPSSPKHSDSDESFSPPQSKQELDSISLASKRRKSSIMPIMESIKEEEETQLKNSENYVSELQNERKNPNNFLKILTTGNRKTSEVNSQNNTNRIDSITQTYQIDIQLKEQSEHKQQSNSQQNESFSNKKKVPVKYSGGFNLPNEESSLIQSDKPSELSDRKVTISSKTEELNLIGYALRDCTSQKGYQFFVQKGEKVVIKKIYENANYLKCFYKGMTGILKKSDIAFQNNNIDQQIIKTQQFSQFQTAKLPVKLDLKATQKADLEKILNQIQPVSNFTTQKYYY